MNNHKHDYYVEKIKREYDEFINSLEKLTKEEIIEHSYEKVCKEELVYTLTNLIDLDYCEFDEVYATAFTELLDCDNTLDMLYHKWLKTDVHFNSLLEDLVEEVIHNAKQ